MKTFEIKIDNWDILEVELEDNFEYWDNFSYESNNYIYSDYDECYIREDESIYTADEWYIHQDNDYYMDYSNDKFYAHQWDLVYCEDIREYSSEYTKTYDTENYFYSSNGLYWCEDKSEYYEDEWELYYHENEWCYYSYPEEEYYWHNNWDYWDKSNWAKIKIWLEIEKEEWLEDYEVLTSNSFWINDDWSVDWWEYTTPVLDIENAIEFLGQVKFRPLFDLPTSSNCGWHIHISHSDYNNEALYYKIKEYRPILWALYPERSRNNYCSKSEWDTNPHSKRSDVHIHYNTVEFRIFPAVESFNQVKFRISLLNFFVNNLIDTKEEALNILNEKSLEFISILDIAYKSLERKQEVLERIVSAFEVDSTKDWEIKTFLKEQCLNLNK